MTTTYRRPPRAAVIGAGASGLVTAKTLKANGYDVEIFDRNAEIGGLFRYMIYETAEMVSSKYLTAFTDFRPPASAPDFFTAPEYVAYLNAYADHFGLRPLIRFSATVKSLVHEGPGRHRIEFQHNGTEQVGTYDVVALCSGRHAVGDRPSFPGADSFPGEILHSVDYRRPSQFAGKRVLVIGAAETACDIAHDASQVASQVCIAVRSSFTFLPKISRGFPGLHESRVPTDTFIYRPTDFADAMKLRVLYHLALLALAAPVERLLCGEREPLIPYSMEILRKRRSVFVNKSTRLVSQLRRDPPGQPPPTRGSRTEVNSPVSISVRPGVARIEGSTVHFEDGSSFDADLIVMGTGVLPNLSFLLPEDRAIDNCLRGIALRGDPTIGFIGYMRPNFGAIPPVSEMQVMWWIALLKGLIRPSLLEQEFREEWAMDHPHIRGGIIYAEYILRLARDMGAVPSISSLLQNPRVLLAYLVGGVYPLNYRLEGPFPQDTAAEIMGREIFGLITRRTLAEHAVVFSTTFLIYLCSGLAAALGRITPSRSGG